MNLKNLFKKEKKNIGRVSTSCEDPNTTYLTFPDGLRIVINDGKYVGWYVTGCD
jgi:hypothetical protein